MVNIDNATRYPAGTAAVLVEDLGEYPTVIDLRAARHVLDELDDPTVYDLMVLDYGDPLAQT